MSIQLFFQTQFSNIFPLRFLHQVINRKKMYVQKAMRFQSPFFGCLHHNLDSPKNLQGVNSPDLSPYTKSCLAVVYTGLISTNNIFLKTFQSKQTIRVKKHRFRSLNRKSTYPILPESAMNFVLTRYSVSIFSVSAG